MKKTDKISYLQKSPEELKKNLMDLRKKYIEIRSKLLTGNVKDTSVLKKIKYEISLVSTILAKNEK